MGRRTKTRKRRGGNGKGDKIPSKRTTVRKRSAALGFISPAYRRLSSKIDKSKKRKIIVEQVQKEAKKRGLIVSRTQISSDLKTLPPAEQHHHSHLLDVYLQQAQQDKERGQTRSNKTTRGGRRRHRRRRHRNRRTRKRRGGWFGSNWFSGWFGSNWFSNTFGFGSWGKKPKKGLIKGSWTSKGMSCNPNLPLQCSGGLKCARSGLGIGPFGSGKCVMR